MKIYDNGITATFLAVKSFTIPGRSSIENETAESAMVKAMAQIEEKNYAAELVARGIKTVKLLEIGIEGKEVWVREKTGN